MGKKNRAGSFRQGANSIETFVPNPLPPAPPLEIDDELMVLLSKAHSEVGRLDGATGSLPNPDLFVMMYVRKEAVYSSQIEGTHASLLDVIGFESEILRPEEPADVKEVVNYVSAMDHGLEKINKGATISIDLMCEIHSILMKGVRGEDKEPGRLRSRQNYIGIEGGSIRDAIFVPPSVDDMHIALRDLERFIRNKAPIPPLVKVGLVHSQFETIHPFLDGNGRMGRLLITFLLTSEGNLRRPLLYLSHHMRKNQQEYYRRLQAVRREGDWEGWISFFLKGIIEVSKEAIQTSDQVIELKDRHTLLVRERRKGGVGNALRFLDSLFERPMTSVKGAAKRTGLTFKGASKLVSKFEDIGVLVETTGRSRNRIFEYREYLRLLSR